MGPWLPLKVFTKDIQDFHRLLFMIQPTSFHPKYTNPRRKFQIQTPIALPRMWSIIIIHIQNYKLIKCKIHTTN